MENPINNLGQLFLSGSCAHQLLSLKTNLCRNEILRTKLEREWGKKKKTHKHTHKHTHTQEYRTEAVPWRGLEAHFLAAQVQSTPKPIALHSSCFLFLQYTRPEKDEEKESGQHENKQET
jgi:hypothetical protein